MEIKRARKKKEKERRKRRERKRPDLSLEAGYYLTLFRFGAALWFKGRLCVLFDGQTFRDGRASPIHIGSSVCTSLHYDCPAT